MSPEELSEPVFSRWHCFHPPSPTAPTHIPPGPPHWPGEVQASALQPRSFTLWLQSQMALSILVCCAVIQWEL